MFTAGKAIQKKPTAQVLRTPLLRLAGSQKKGAQFQTAKSEESGGRYVAISMFLFHSFYEGFLMAYDQNCFLRTTKYDYFHWWNLKSEVTFPWAAPRRPESLAGIPKGCWMPFRSSRDPATHPMSGETAQRCGLFLKRCRVQEGPPMVPVDGYARQGGYGMFSNIVKTC